ncbi:doublecortin domain containing 2C [Nothobranchius furzeri]|uniref:Doublecortin domain containing 2C n=2 Tax=Nothobranchius furzeri TaxID=105023 RepID=A0A9D2XG47_NOTFU|nr:doublecortin domain containing 2C [Nothobranchius furzeri]
MDQPPTKTVTVYRNGDAFYPGRKVVVNPHQVTTFDNFLTNLTKKIEAPFGAVRRLYTPTQGHKVQHLEELKHGHAYVAAGYEAFKTLNVFTNGELLIPAARIRIPKHTLKSWEDVLSMVTEKVALRTGAVFSQYNERKKPQKDAVFFKKDLKLTARGQMKEHTANMETVEQRRQVSKIPALFSAGESSVFNAQSKRSETAGATEVQDDRQVQVDLPIDQVEAKTVEEEHVDVEDVGDMNASQDDSDAESLQQSSYEGSQNT